MIAGALAVLALSAGAVVVLSRKRNKGAIPLFLRSKKAPQMGGLFMSITPRLPGRDDATCGRQDAPLVYL